MQLNFRCLLSTTYDGKRLAPFIAVMNTLLRDLRYGMRTLTRNPTFAAVAVLTIGIGIGASTTIFSWMRPMLLDPLPGATQADRIVASRTWRLTASRSPRLTWTSAISATI